MGKVAPSIVGIPVLGIRLRWPTGIKHKLDCVEKSDCEDVGAYITAVSKCGNRLESYELAEHPALFHIFASTPTTVHGIIEFANQFGNLGCLDLAPKGDQAYHAIDKSYQLAELPQRLGRWMKEITLMSSFIDLVEKEEPIDKNTAQHMSEEIRGRIAKIPISFQIESRTDSSANAGFILTADCLLSGLWLQFVEALTNNKRYRRCTGRGCLNWINVTFGVHRSDKQFCSDACRVRTSRDRRK